MSQYEDLSMDVQYPPKGVIQWPGANPVLGRWSQGNPSDGQLDSLGQSIGELQVH